MNSSQYDAQPESTYLQDNSQEVEALFQDFLLHDTSFFRDPEAFQVLKEQVFPSIMLNRAPEGPIRIWVPGCSTGEEVYSIAICLLEFLDARHPLPTIQIFGPDISEPAIEKARLGVYIASQVGKISLERLRRFFFKVEGGYEISKSVRQMCIFAKQNLLADPPFSHLDLISCRNVVIHLEPALQKKVFPSFHYSLKPTGFLLLGTAESTGEFSDLFALVDRQKIYSRKSKTQARLNFDLVTSNYFGQQASGQKRNEDAKSEFDLQKEADRIVWNKYAPAGVIINSELEILQFRGEVSPYLEPAPGKPSLNLLNMASASLRLELRKALSQAKRLDVPVRKLSIQVAGREQLRQLNLEVIPFKAPPLKERYFLVLFEDVPASDSQSLDRNRSGNPRRGKQTATQELLQLKQELATTKQELAATKEYLQSIIQEQEATNQELTTANEEILSSNEDLQSINEELETAKEEIQSTNEELNTTNGELQSRIGESNQVNNDLRNLLSSVNIPIVMVGNDLTIRRFTPMAEKVFNLLPDDLGRPLNHIKPNINVPDLEQLILEVLATLLTKEQEVQDQAGHWYDLRISPYKTIENQIDGAVIVLVNDITERKLLESQRNQLLTHEQSARTAAESANRAKDEFLSIVSHELRSPLNSVLGWTNLLRNRRLDIAQTARALETIEGAGLCAHPSGEGAWCRVRGNSCGSLNGRRESRRAKKVSGSRFSKVYR